MSVRKAPSVRGDEVWKDHCRKEVVERHGGRKWEAKWGYLVTEYGRLQQELTKRDSSTPLLPARYRTVNSEDLAKTPEKLLKLPPVPGVGSKVNWFYGNGTPQTTTKEYGFGQTDRWIKTCLRLDRIGPQVLRLKSICKDFGWPEESIE